MKSPNRTRHLLLSLAAMTLVATAPLHANDLDDTDADDTTESPPTPTPTTPATQKIQRENLITNPPFRIIRRPRVQQSGTTQQPLEIRGFTGTGDNLEISLTNPATRECHWVKIRDEDAKWYVESADPITRTATVRMNGIAMSLEMAKANEAPIPITPAATPTPVQGRGIIPAATPATNPGIPATATRTPRNSNWRPSDPSLNATPSGENYPRSRNYGSANPNPQNPRRR
ncbi:MAG: hypothetical protein LBD14_00495 [Puniceicoccales bacterium]|jgi:hypothetical protein|nr:hypothetical protein [Puniceicoccales bacterium]